MTTWTPLRRSAMHQHHLALGASMVDQDGWQQPKSYGSVDGELRSLRESVGLCDVSPAAKLILKGRHVGQVVSTSFPGAAPLDTGTVTTVVLTDRPEIGVVRLARLADDELIALTDTGLSGGLADYLGGSPDNCFHLVDMTSALAGVRLIGPSAPELLTDLAESDTSDFAFHDRQCVQTRVAGIHGLILRWDTAGLPGYEIYFSRDFGEYLWDVLLEAGEELGGIPVGVESLAQLQV